MICSRNLLCRLALGAAVLCIATAPLAHAQKAADYAGQWGCRYSMQPFSGSPLDTHYWEFGILLDTSGRYGMQGFYYSPSIGSQIPVQGEGSWGSTNDGPHGFALSVRGQILRQDSGWMQFGFIATPTDANTLYYQFRGNTHMTNVSCQR